MQMVHEILHTMAKGKERWFYGRIHVYTQLHGKTLNVVLCLNSNMHETFYPVVELSSIFLFRLVQFFSNKWRSHE